MADSPGLEVYGFGTFPEISAGTALAYVTVSINQYASTVAMSAPTFELWDGTSAKIGATQTGTVSTSSSHVDTANIVGVTYSQLATLRVRIYAHGTTGNVQSVDYVTLDAVPQITLADAGTAVDNVTPPTGDIGSAKDSIFVSDDTVYVYSMQADALTGGAKYAAGYYPIWEPMPRLININQNYQNIILFEALPVGGANGSGAIQWDAWDDTNGSYTNRIADIAAVRARGQRIILSIGGDTGDMNFTSRTKSQTCIDSIKALATAIGGIDGIDWDNYENVVPNTTEYVWMGQQLKSPSYFGSSFIIQSAVGPWRASELSGFFTALFNGGALDYVMPMEYADTVYNQSYILNNATEGIGAWATAIGGYDRLVIGFGIDDTLPADYMTSAEILSTWNAAVAAHPTLGGAACWNIYNDIYQTSGAANSIATGTMSAVISAGGGTPIALSNTATAATSITILKDSTPVVYGVGGAAVGTGAITPPLPASPQDGDLGIMFLETQNQAITVANWTAASSSPQSEATDATRLTVYYRWWQAGDTAQATSDSGNHQIGRIIGVRGGIVGGGNPFEVTTGATSSTSSTTATIPGVTTSGNSRLIITACGVGTDLTTSVNFSNWANSSLTDLTEQADSVTATGSGGGFGVATGGLTSPGNSGNTTVTLATAARKTYWTAAILPGVEPKALLDAGHATDTTVASAAFIDAGHCVDSLTIVSTSIVPVAYESGSAATSLSVAKSAAPAPPTLITSYFVNTGAVADLSSLVSSTFTPAVGEVLVVKIVAGWVDCIPGTPTGGGLTFAQRISWPTPDPYFRMFTAVTTSTGLMSVTVPFTGSAEPHAMVVERWSGAQLAGSPVTVAISGSGAPSATIVTTADNSVVSWWNNDNQNNSGVGRVYRTASAIPVEEAYYAESTFFSGTYYSAYQEALTAGSQTIGLSAPTGQGWRLYAIEVQSSVLVDVPKTLEDGGYAVDTATTTAIGVPKLLPDTGFGAERSTATVAARSADAGTARDSLNVQLPRTLNDVGVGAESSTLVGPLNLGYGMGYTAGYLQWTTSTSPVLSEQGSAATNLVTVVTGVLSDTASAATTVAVAATFPIGDTGAAADSPAGATVTTQAGDAATAATTSTVAAAVILSDVAVAADRIAAGIAIPFGDAGTAADSLDSPADVPLAQAGTAADGLTHDVAPGLLDVGSATETLASSAAVVLSDDAVAVTTVNVAGSNVFTGYDLGVGEDTSTVTVTTTCGDVGSASDTLSGGSAVLSVDAGVGVDRIAITQTHSANDVGQCADQLAVTAAHTLPAVSAAGTDRLIVLAAPVLNDSGTGVSSITAGLLITDTGVGADSLSVAVHTYPSDAAGAVEILLIGGTLEPIYMPHGIGVVTVVDSGGTTSKLAGVGTSTIIIKASGGSRAATIAGYTGRTLALIRNAGWAAANPYDTGQSGTTIQDDTGISQAVVE